MSNLKELTKDQHTNAERQDFVKVLMSGKINPKFYATYLYNQWKKYDALEEALDRLGLWANDIKMFDIKRAHAINEDWYELWPVDKLRTHPITMPSTWAYLDRIKEIEKDKHTLLAHVYTLHMGDLSGGQMIKRKIPGEGRMYQFNGETSVLKEHLRTYVDDSMADEAKWVFDSATALFQELMEVDIEHYME
jgi:heme oxygenase